MIQDAISKHIQLTKPSLYSKIWWSTELEKEKKKKKTQLGRGSKYHHTSLTHPVHKEYCQQCNSYLEKIWNVKVDHWVEWLEGLNKSNIWQASKLITSPPTDAGSIRIPILQIKDPATKWVIREESDNADKEKLFYETFFPPANPLLTPPPEHFRYPTVDIPEHNRWADTLSHQKTEALQSQLEQTWYSYMPEKISFHILDIFSMPLTHWIIALRYGHS